jgi:D-alanyl-D-alanine carboxypeptidase
MSRKKKRITIRQKQSKFVHMIALLILHAEQKGYEITFGDAYRDPRVKYGHPMSLHRSRLAVDLNLFRDGRYLFSTKSHLPLGEYWESIGGTWGGRFQDGNHYSLEYEGRK